MFRTFGTFGIWAGLMAGGITVFPQEDTNYTFFSPVRIIENNKKKLKGIHAPILYTENSASYM